LTAEELIAFEAECAELFNAGRIRAPCHLSGGNEEQLIEIFNGIDQQDWVLSTYRWHYHALLHGIPREVVIKELLDGRGMNMASVEHRFLTSAIVGGMLPIAVGIAAALKRDGSRRKVWAFCGDMTATTGAFHEATNYARGQGLDEHIRFVIEDNGMATNSPTEECWGRDFIDFFYDFVIHYRYERTYPHVGAGRFVRFT